MSMRVVVGIDPGINGAIAVMVDGYPASVTDMPTIARHNGGNAIEALALHAFFRQLVQRHAGAHMHAVIELPATRPHDAPTNILRIGEGFGILIGVLTCHGITHTQVRPQTWKGFYGLVKTGEYKPTKNDSRARATSMWPEFSLNWHRVCDHDRAEAMLMAHWGNVTECWLPKDTKPVVRKRKPKAKQPELRL